ncbi:MAG: hypothetical protein Fur0014_19110 [Rubrivivax sp.]
MLAALAAVPAAARPLQAEFVGRWVDPDESLVLRVDAEQQAGWRGWRLFLGTSEVTALLRLAAPGVLELRPVATAWAAGEGELVVYDGERWAELARWPVRVRGAGGFETQQGQPRLDLQLEGRADEGRSDGQPVTPRGAHADAAVSGGIAWQGTRGGFGFEAAANLVGNSHQGKALRFGERGARAPKLDLADYRVALTHGRHTLALGHLSAGTHPLLASGLSSRGVGLTTRLGTRADLALHALSGTAIVGWDNLTGLEEADHQARLLTLGVELLPARPGGLRAEFSLLDASLQPRSGFDAGAVPDAERSRGLGLRLLAASESGRWQGEVALARSRFTNPFDPALALDGELRVVEPTTRNALLASMHWAVLQQHALAGHPLDLTLALRHERAAPLYRSLAAYVTPDQQATRAGLQAGWHGATARLDAGVRVDNLARIATLLRTRTDEQQLALTLPLPTWMAPAGSAQAGGLWPMLSWTWQQVHQRAVNAPVPEDSGFAATHRPDQIDQSQRVDLTWALPAGSLRYGLVRSRVDNRQPGRERADFERLAHQAAVDHAFGKAWRVGLALTRSSEHSLEAGLVRWRTGGSAQLAWQASERWALSASVSHDVAHDSGDRARQTDEGVQLQATRRLELPALGRTLPGQFFVRAAHQGQRQRDNVFDLSADLRSWWVDFGMSLSFF